jgi:hypothetical protein
MPERFNKSFSAWLSSDKESPMPHSTLLKFLLLLPLSAPIMMADQAAALTQLQSDLKPGQILEIMTDAQDFSVIPEAMALLKDSDPRIRLLAAQFLGHGAEARVYSALPNLPGAAEVVKAYYYVCRGSTSDIFY